jgi:hypothetical protein
MDPMQNTRLKLIAAALVAGIALLGATQIASAQTSPTVSSSLQAQAKPAQTADVAEAGDTPDVAGAAEAADTVEAADTAEAGDVADAAEPAGGADTDQVQDGNQSGPETPDAPSSK